MLIGLIRSSHSPKILNPEPLMNRPAADGVCWSLNIKFNQPPAVCSRCLLDYLFGIERFTFLPYGQSYGCDLTCDRYPR